MKRERAWLSWNLDDRPTITLAGSFRLADRGFDFVHNVPWHTLHVYQYAARVRIGGVDLSIKPGDFSITPAGTDSSYDLPKPGLHWAVRFDPVHRRSKENEITLDLPRHGSLGAEAASVSATMSLIARLWTESWRDPLANEEASSLLLALLIRIARLNAVGKRSRAHPSHRVAERAMELINGDYFNPQLTMIDLARRVGVGQGYLAKMFRARFGLTMPHYLLRRRIDAAREQIESTALPIGGIAASVGMPNTRNFYKQFRRLVGMSPSHVRAVSQATRGLDTRPEDGSAKGNR